MPAERRALLRLVSRFEISGEQATRFYVAEEREKARIGASDADLLANPFLLFELDRTQEAPIAVDTVDRGVFPDPAVRAEFPLPAPSAMSDAIDPRRVTALTIDTLEDAAGQGHTLLPRAWVVQRMLTEEQLAALLDALQGVDRLILVGDPRQLPPIGAGRPFVDIVEQLKPLNVEANRAG